MPIKMKKPDGYYRYGSRLVDGKITINYYSSQKTSSTGQFSGMLLWRAKMPDGITYDISGKNLKKVILPYMLQCSEFDNYYKNDTSVKTSSLEEIVASYNKMCK